MGNHIRICTVCYHKINPATEKNSKIPPGIPCNEIIENFITVENFMDVIFHLVYVDCIIKRFVLLELTLG